MDLQDPALKVFNVELLEMAGILLRLTLEHNMYSQVDVAWKEHQAEREALEESLQQQEQARRRKEPSSKEIAASVHEAMRRRLPNWKSTTSSSGLMGFARFMARYVRNEIRGKRLTFMYSGKCTDEWLFAVSQGSQKEDCVGREYG